ncbi:MULTISPECIES: hypothetical protein [unclassified Streptomyces]|uniref:hypothetical protein n=1 Tax=unclassified Streptomyces TaxID=2593676 RepID=UPI00036480A1|nr:MULTISPECIES: hypothetical protein [unclassified Streptomyces]MYT32752.1 hypothetical protein [Streptomyces sp. SID8354]
MSDNQPQHQNPYDGYDPYAHPSPDHRPSTTPLHGDTSRYAPTPGYAPQAPYGSPYGQQPYDPYLQQQPEAQQPQPQPQPQQPYGYEAYGQQQPQHPAAPYGQDAYGHGPDTYGQDPAPYGQDTYAAPAPQPHQGMHAAPHRSAPDQPGHQAAPQAPRHAAPQPPAYEAAQGITHGTTATAEPVPADHPEPQAAALEPADAAAAPLKPNQLARLEGRSPIIPPGIQPAALTALLALLLALAAPIARPVLAVPVVLLQAVTAAGWFRLNGMWPARQGIALAFLGGLATDAGLLATPHEDAPLVAIGTLGVWCLLVIVLQLRNRSSADERMYALTAGLTASALAVLAAGQLAADPDAMVVGATAVALAALARALPLPGPVTLVLGLLAGVGGGIAAGQLTGMGTAGALLGLAAGGCALIGLRVASYDYPSKFVHMTAGVALPLALAAPAVYVLGRALG